MNKPYQKTGILYRRLFSYIKPFWPILLLGIFANITYSGIDATFTYLLRPFLDKSFFNLDLAFVKKIPFIVLLGVICRGSVHALGSYCMTWIARAVIRDLRQAVFAHMIKLPAATFDRLSSGHLLAKLLYNVEQVAQVSADTLTDLVQNIFLVIGLLIVMFAICWQLSLLFLLTVPFVAFIVNYSNKRVRKMSHRIQKTMSEVTEIATEVIENYRVVRIFAGEEHEIEKFNQATERSRHNDMKVAMTKAMNVFGVQLIIALGISLIMLTAIHLATWITITAGSFLAIIAAMLQLIRPMKALATVNASIQKGLAGAESVFQLLDEPLERKEGKNLPQKLRGSIEFDQVSFSYDAKNKVLNQVSFKINPGEKVALVGHSGSGKSTIVSLLCHFYEAQSGNIRVDGQAIKQISVQSLRNQIALVTQQITLFNDSFAKNIAYGPMQWSRKEIIQAAQLAYAHEFIEKMPQGYDTKIGENGTLLSGGQRQRLAIARAILKNAPILILDEATSALDNESEAYIQSALEEVMRNRTTLIIAHRLSTIKKADKIIVLQKGQVIEQGRHEELLALNGYYKQLYQGREFWTAQKQEVIV